MIVSRMRCRSPLVLLALLVAAARLPAQEGSAALRKSDLVRLLTSTTYSKGEVAAIVRRSCLAFVPSTRDRDDLRALGADAVVFREIDRCVAAGNNPVAARQPPPPPKPLAVSVLTPTVSAAAGAVAYVSVRLTRGTAPVSASRLVLTGATAITGGTSVDPAAITDADGRATFTLPAGTRAATYRLAVAGGDGSMLDERAGIVLTTLPAAPTIARLAPPVVAIGTGTPRTVSVAATITDPFGNPVPGFAVDLRAHGASARFAAEARRTDPSGEAHFSVSTASLHDGDSLAVMAGGRALALLPVSASERVTAQIVEAERRAALGGPGAEAAYDSVLAVDPGNVPALLGRGYLRGWERKYDAAREDFGAVMRQPAQRAAGLAGLGYTALRAGQYADAAIRFDSALALAPDAQGAATGAAYAELWGHDPRQAARRSETLRAPQPVTYPAAAGTAFRDGIALVVRRRLDAADRALTNAIGIAPSWPEAYYNRALVRQAEGRAEAAVADLRKYLQLRPDAGDRADVSQRIEILGRSGGGAFARGLLLPGLGQFTGGQPALGAVVLAAAGGGAAWALTPKTTTETQTFTDPFGQTYTTTVNVSKRPNLGVGLAVAGGAWLLGAIQAAAHAGSAKRDVTLPSAAPGGKAGTASAVRYTIYPVVALRAAGTALGAGISIPIR